MKAKIRKFLGDVNVFLIGLFCHIRMNVDIRRTRFNMRYGLLLAVGVLLLSIPNVIAQEKAEFGIFYATTSVADGGNLIAIDPATGAGTLIGRTGLEAVPGLAINSRGEIFATDLTSGALYRLNAVTGEAIFVAMTGLPFLEAIAFDSSDVLFGISGSKTLFGTSDRRLYTIDVSTGFPTAIGPTVDLAGLAFDPIDGTSWASSGILSQFPDGIFMISPTTASLTFVGNTVYLKQKD